MRVEFSLSYPQLHSSIPAVPDLSTISSLLLVRRGETVEDTVLDLRHLPADSKLDLETYYLDIGTLDLTVDVSTTSHSRQLSLPVRILVSTAKLPSNDTASDSLDCTPELLNASIIRLLRSESYLPNTLKCIQSLLNHSINDLPTAGYQRTLAINCSYLLSRGIEVRDGLMYITGSNDLKLTLDVELPARCHFMNPEAYSVSLDGYLAVKPTLRLAGSRGRVDAASVVRAYRDSEAVRAMWGGSE